VVSIDWSKAFGSGILHTKLFVADDDGKIQILFRFIDHI
jgi:uncharacterized protein YccT (UPF0319 family)